jgi:hypothetical protein
MRETGGPTPAPRRRPQRVGNLRLGDVVKTTLSVLGRNLPAFLALAVVPLVPNALTTGVLEFTDWREAVGSPKIVEAIE